MTGGRDVFIREKQNSGDIDDSSIEDGLDLTCCAIAPLNPKDYKKMETTHTVVQSPPKSSSGIVHSFHRSRISAQPDG